MPPTSHPRGAEQWLCRAHLSSPSREEGSARGSKASHSLPSGSLSLASCFPSLSLPITPNLNLTWPLSVSLSSETHTALLPTRQSCAWAPGRPVASVVPFLSFSGSLKCKWCRGTDYNAAPIKVFGCHNALTSTSRLSSSTGVGKRKVDLCFLFSFPKSESLYRRDFLKTRRRKTIARQDSVWECAK